MRSYTLALACLVLAAGPPAAAAAEVPPATTDVAPPATTDTAPPAVTDTAPPAVTPAEAPSDPAMDAALAKQRSRAVGLAVHGGELLRAGLDDQAIAAYGEALQAWPAYPLALNELGAIYAKKKELARAEALLQQALQLDPEFTAARANLAEVQRRMGRFPAAIESYHAVLDASPEDPDAHYGLAAAFARAGDKPAARWAMERYLKLVGDDAEGPRVAEVEEQLERLDDDDVEARAPWVVASVTKQPAEPPRHAGDEKFYARRYMEALAAYRAALGDGDDVVLLYKIGATYAVMNDYRSALNWWRRALLLEPDRELVVRHLGLATIKLAAQSPPSSPAIPDPLEGARVALIAGDAAAAVARLAGEAGEEAAQLRGEALLLLGDLAGARASFESILNARPDDRDASGGLAEALARQGASAPAAAAMRQWLGDRDVPPETFLVLRSNDFVTRLTSEPEE
ncbi:MAG: hypothetical protein CVU56_29505 [Deltaproteobacteria bacterium HGW-Deltaproteobacteria-14]|nr:MAG: hypothetical protein CVU56_29505 [Deltaproteobacteria bacterium HGW-Deltaproteobacteria-14]